MSHFLTAFTSLFLEYDSPFLLISAWSYLSLGLKVKYWWVQRQILALPSRYTSSYVASQRPRCGRCDSTLLASYRCIYEQSLTALPLFWSQSLECRILIGRFRFGAGFLQPLSLHSLRSLWYAFLSRPSCFHIRRTPRSETRVLSYGDRPHPESLWLCGDLSRYPRFYYHDENHV